VVLECQCLGDAFAVALFFVFDINQLLPSCWLITSSACAVVVVAVDDDGVERDDFDPIHLHLPHWSAVELVAN